MYCYNCEESTEESTKTISTTCTSETPTENCSKQGNGYAKITLISYWLYKKIDDWLLLKSSVFSLIFHLL